MAQQKKHRNIGHAIARIFGTLLLIGVLCACFCGLAFAYYVHTYINPQVETDVSTMGMDLNSFIYATDPETGEEVLYETVTGLEDRVWVDSEHIPQYLKDAFVAIEDQRFYQHKGVDWRRTFGASLKWITGNATYGGSTITQQLIKNVTRQDDFSVKRKINEIFRALALEKQIDDKDRILELYMNYIFLGRNKYGVQSASRTYFGKDVDQLSLAQCAVLAGITNNPAEYDPYNNPDNVKKRQTTILDQMLAQGRITQQEHDAAVAEPLEYRPLEAYQQEQKEAYSYFTDEVINNVIDDLVNKKGYSKSVASDLVGSGGLKIYATIDTRIQKIMDEEYANDANFPNYERDGLRPESAMVIVDAEGNIKGIVGGRGEKQGKLTGSYATTTRRQPGSSFKPLSTYGPAMDAGIIVPTSEVYDKALREGEDGKPWPLNDGKYPTGRPLVIKNAIARSVNTISVQTLNMLTPQRSFAFLTEKLGFQLVASRNNADGTVSSDIDLAPLALGGLTDGVTVREMAGGYAAFINNGAFEGTRTYTKVLDSNGELLLDNTPEVIGGFEHTHTAYHMLECLQAVTSYGTATNATIPGVETGGKTGTTSSNYDLWFCGVTPKYAAAVWLGYDRNYTLNGMYGRDAAAIWTKIMRRVHEGQSGLTFQSLATQAGLKTAQYCMDSGLIPSGACYEAGRVATGLFRPDEMPTGLCRHQGYKKYDYGKETGVDVGYEEEPEKPVEKPKDPATTDPETGETVIPPEEGSGDNNGSQGNNTTNTLPPVEPESPPNTTTEPTSPPSDDPEA